MNPEIEKKLAEIRRLRADWAQPDCEVAVLRLAWAAWCNAGIEGNPLPWEDARSLLESRRAGEGRWEKEVVGCYNTLYGAETGLIARPDDVAIFPVDWAPSLLRHLHGEVMEGLGPGGGHFRSKEVKIVRESGPNAGEVVFAPPHPARIPELIEKLLADLREQIASPQDDPLLIAGRFHYEFQSIHPFEDGNGRLGRILSCVLARQGWDSGGFYIAPTLREWANGYYLALRAVRAGYEDEADLTPWLEKWLDRMILAFSTQFDMRDKS